MMPGLGSIDQPMTLAQAVSYPFIAPGHTIYLRGGVHSGDYTWTISGNAASPITIRAYPGERAIIDGSLIINGHYTDWYNVEIMKSGWTRETEIPGSDPADIDGGELTIHGIRTRMYGCVVHDVQSVGFWSDAVGAVLADCLIYHIGWQGPDRGHGHIIYSQNATGTKTVKNCIGRDNFGTGFIVYGSSGSTLVGYDFQHNTAFRNGSLASDPTNGFLIGGESGAVMSNIIFNANMSYPGNYGAQIGYNSGGNNITITNNYLPNNIAKNNLTNLTESGNTYGTVGNVAFVYASDVLTKRGNVTVYNEAAADNVVVDVTGILEVGDDYELRNVQDYYTDIVTSTLGEAGTISVDMRSVSHTVATPVNWDAPSTTFPEFGCFVIEKI